MDIPVDPVARFKRLPVLTEISPVALILPTTDKIAAGLLGSNVPIPTLPLPSIIKGELSVPVWSSTLNE